MNRRNFLKMLGLSAIAPFIPLPKTEPPKIIPMLTDKEVEKIKEEWEKAYKTTSNGVSGYITYTSNAGDYSYIYVNNPFVIWDNVPHLFERT